MMNSPAFFLGRFLGMVQLVELGLVNTTHFTNQCIEIAKEYEASKADPEAPYKAQAEKIKTMYNAIAKREGLEDANEQY